MHLQAVMENLAKEHPAQQWAVDPNSIYHCAVSPPYTDKPPGAAGRLLHARSFPG